MLIYRSISHTIETPPLPADVHQLCQLAKHYKCFVTSALNRSRTSSNIRLKRRIVLWMTQWQMSLINPDFEDTTAFSEELKI